MIPLLKICYNVCHTNMNVNCVPAGIVRHNQRHRKEGFKMKGFIFDLDGTLLDSMPSWQHQLDDMLMARGITPPDDLLDRTKTLGLENATGMILQEFHLPDDPSVVYQQFQDNMEQLYCTAIALKPGVRAFLDRLMADNIPMAVATATARPLVERALACQNLSQYFQSITTVAEVGIGKHNPRVFLAAADKLGLPAQQCIVVEDSLKAIRSASQAGFQTIAIYEATNPAEQQALQQEADRYIHDFRDFSSLHDDIFE